MIRYLGRVKREGTNLPDDTTVEVNQVSEPCT